MFIYGPNTTTPTTPHPPTPPHRMTVMTPVKMMNTTLKGTRINQANKKSPECPLTLLANKDIQGLLPLWGVRGGGGGAHIALWGPGFTSSSKPDWGSETDWLLIRGRGGAFTCTLVKFIRHDRTEASHEL